MRTQQCALRQRVSELRGQGARPQPPNIQRTLATRPSACLAPWTKDKRVPPKCSNKRPNHEQEAAPPCHVENSFAPLPRPRTDHPAIITHTSAHTNHPTH